MKKLLSALAIFTLFNSFGQVPQKMSYQTIVRNSSNQLIPNNTVGMRLSILEGSPTGTAVYVETHTPTTNGNGSATIEVGAGTVVSGTFNTIDWSTGNYWLQTEIDPQGGQGYSITGVSQLLTVPYAFFCDEALNAGNGIDTAQVINDSLYITTVNGTTVNAGLVGTGGFSHYIGEEFGGGVIFHLWKDAQGVEHGLIVGPEDLHDQFGNGAMWGLLGTDVANCESTWNGAANTSAIVAAGGLTTDAAGLCDNYTGGGFNDWYLPAFDEMRKIYLNRVDVNRGLSQVTNGQEISLWEPTYWTSTESTTSGSNSSYYYFGDNLQNQLTPFKDSYYSVRPIRQF